MKEGKFMKPMKKVLSLLCSLLCVLFIGSSVPAFAYPPCYWEDKLYKAIENGNTPTAIRIINNYDINVEARYDTLSFLERAIRNNNYAVTKLLLEHGANPNSRGIGRETPLHMACCREHPNFAILRLLIDYGADVNAVDKCNDNALYFALIGNDYGGDAVLPVVRFLLEAGVVPNVTNNKWKNTLDECRRRDPKSPKTEELLKQYGAKSAE